MPDHIDWDKVRGITYLQVADFAVGAIVDTALLPLKALPSVDKKIRPIFELAAKNVAKDHPEDLKKLLGAVSNKLSPLTLKFSRKRLTSDQEVDNFIKSEVTKEDIGEH